ncbi:hypothetical protein CDL12_21724 [Handroanthus impetiginosus]|uniref:GATA-type domain-containing protein n=1 Tax=Handroanthus impetiginosus TaxID=429701 RepID=A0A2G9GKC7_9LAMI|nr:hypothetical protein CDL12_21724 [Handroanthus impetiginosus]
MNLNSPPFPIDQINLHDHIHHQQYPFASNHQLASSSSSCHFFTQDHSGYFRPQFYHQKNDNYGYDGGSPYEIKNKVDGGALKLTLWKKEDEGPADQNKLIKKMKITCKVEDQKVQPSSSLETDLSSNSSPYNCNSPVRVCADCHTTKTPLWRSGPKGPKSLCNACGIRQRKARRAMAAAAAAANGTAVVSDQPPAIMKIKLKHKEKMDKNGHSSQLKKRGKMASAAGSSSDSEQKKLGFEDFLINLSNNLSFHRVFPQDEKDAAILLMALSSGLVHG